jgi:hypothetical protein
MTCRHSDADAYILGAGPVWVRYCRHAGCEQWTIQTEGHGGWNGLGLDDYRDAIADAARTLPDWDGAALLYDLCGHAREVER